MRFNDRMKKNAKLLFSKNKVGRGDIGSLRRRKYTHESMLPEDLLATDIPNEILCVMHTVFLTMYELGLTTDEKKEIDTSVSSKDMLCNFHIQSLIHWGNFMKHDDEDNEKKVILIDP